MRILVISNNPDRASFRQRIAIHLDALRLNGIESEIAKLPPGYLKRLRLFKTATEFDAVFLHKKCLNFFDAALLHKYSRKIIYDFDDAIMYSPKNPASDRTSHFRLFRRTVKLSDMIIAGNCYLAEHAKRFNDNVKVLPTGLDTKAYNPEIRPRSNGKIRLVWIGSKSTLKYLAEIKPALEQIGERFSNVVLRIICDDFFDLENMEVEKCRWSLETQYTDLAASHIGLAPLPDNRFTMGKCGFKILQYASAGLPVVASPVGVNCECVLEGITGYHASQISQWADKISELINNIELTKKMGQEALKHAKKFDVSIVGNKLVELIKETVQPSSFQ